MEPTRNDIIEALRQLIDPFAGRDVVSLDLVRDVSVKDGFVVIALDSISPGTESQLDLERKAEELVRSVPGVKNVIVRVGWVVPRVQPNLEKQSVPGVNNIVAVSSGKGGVGKSTVAVNLAVSLSRYGARVGLLDTDVYGPNVPIMVGVNSEPKFSGQRLLPHQAHGVRVMSLGFLNPGDRPVVWRGPMLHTAVRQFLYDVEWGELDFLIVDMPPGTGDAQLSLAQLVPVQGAVLVTTP